MNGTGKMRGSEHWQPTDVPDMLKKMELVDYLNRVEDQSSFIEFVKALQADKEDENQKENEKPSNPYGYGWNGWENSTIEGFLESAIAWAEASEFGDRIEKTNNLWKKFAMFLYGGKIYE